MCVPPGSIVLSPPMAPSRESAFRSLRPSCVKLSHLSLQAREGAKIDARELNSTLTNLHESLKQIEQLDDALCDYVLFPLLPIFRHTSSLPSSVIAVALQCLRNLLDKGSAVTAKPEVASQLLVLFMSLLQKQASQLSSRNANEQQVLALCQCLESLLKKGQPSFPTMATSGTEPRIIITGNLLADLLDVSLNDQVAAAQVPSLHAIRLLVSYEKQADVIRRFLPGILSKLTKPSFTTATKGTSYKALVASLEVLRTVLPTAIGQKSSKGDEPSPGPKAPNLSTSEPWLEKHAVHIKSALQNVIRLAVHQRQEVRVALFDLCRDLLEARSVSADVTSLLLDTAIQLCGEDMSEAEQTLAGLIEDNASLQASFSRILSSVLQNIPSDMQSADTSKHRTTIQKAQSCLRLASELPPGLEDPSDLAAESLLDCVRLLESSQNSSIAVTSSSELTIEGSSDASLSEIFGGKAGIQDDVNLLQSLIHTILGTRFAPSLLDYLSDVDQTFYGKTGLSRLWVLAVSLQDVPSTSKGDHSGEKVLVDVYKDSAMSTAYDASLALLDQAPYTADWRLQALALDLTAAYAAQMSSDYMPELSFALYPMVERVACQDERLRRHASKALARVARACGYAHLQDILLQNVDYLVNAVSIKLNDLEPRPEAARVLQAAIKIGGAPMLPHLGSVLESVFSVLDSYHGYPVVVDSMFSVLSAVIEQAPVRNNGDPDKNRILQHDERLTAATVIEQLSKHGVLASDDSLDEDVLNTAIHEDKHTLPGDDSSTNQNTGEEGDNSIASLDSVSEKSEKAITSLVARIVRHSQHFLTHASPSIRLGLLSQVLCRGLATVEHEEDTLLPIVNDVWPVLIARVYDTEPYVSVAGLETLAATVRVAGDFMTSRIEDEWDRLRDFAMKHRPSADETIRKLGNTGHKLSLISQNDFAGMKEHLTDTLIATRRDDRVSTGEQQTGNLRFTAKGRIWDAFIIAATAIITHVRLTAQMETDLFALFGTYLGHNCESVTDTYAASSRRDSIVSLKNALELLNPDFCWLVRWKQYTIAELVEDGEEKDCDGVSSVLTVPKLEGYTFAPLSA